MTMTRKALLAAGFVSLLGVAMPNVASAHDRDRQRDWYRSSARADSSRMSEFQRDRAELRRDQAELERDREDLQRLYRSGASREQIARKRQEIRDDLREIAQDHREVSDSLDSLTRTNDRGLDRSGRYDNNGWGSGRYDRGRSGWSLSDIFDWR